MRSPDSPTRPCPLQDVLFNYPSSMDKNRVTPDGTRNQQIGRSTLDVQGSQIIQNSFTMKGVCAQAKELITKFEAYCKRLDNDSQPNYRLEIVGEPSQLIKACARLLDGRIPRALFEKAVEAGVFFWTKERRDSLSAGDKRVLDRMLYPFLQELDRSHPGGVLRNHPGEQIIGSEIESLYKLPDGTFPTDDVRLEYAKDLDALVDYARELFKALYGGKRITVENRFKLQPSDALVVFEGGKIRVTLVNKAGRSR